MVHSLVILLGNEIILMEVLKEIPVDADVVLPLSLLYVLADMDGNGD